eukprot:2967366-Lingulodinium_polyedra.AAC.1
MFAIRTTLRDGGVGQFPARRPFLRAVSCAMAPSISARARRVACRAPSAASRVPDVPRYYGARG